MLQTDDIYLWENGLEDLEEYRLKYFHPSDEFQYTVTDLPNPNPSGTRYKVSVESIITVRSGGSYTYSVSDAKIIHITLPPKFVTPQTDEPEEPTVVATGPVQNLSLSATDSTLTASWDAPATGSAPIFYAVVVRNTETNKTFFRRNLRDTDTTFKNKLKSGVTYSVSVQARNHTLKGLQYEGIYNKKGVPKPKYFNDNEMFSRSDWVSGEVTLKGEKQASGDSARLIWIYLHPGEKTPGYAVGEPTQNMKRINGEWVPYSAADCKADIDVHSSDIDVIRQQALVDAANAANENAQAELAENPGNPMYQKLAEMAQAEVDAATRILGEIVAEKQADAEAACESKYVEDENLTEADFRWVQVPANMVEDKE